MHLLPCPRSIRRGAGFFILPNPATLRIDSDLPFAEREAVVKRLEPFGISLASRTANAVVHAIQTKAVAQAEGYAMLVNRSGVRLEFREVAGLRAAIATLRQLLGQYGRKLPFLKIRD